MEHHHHDPHLQCRPAPADQLAGMLNSVIGIASSALYGGGRMARSLYDGMVWGDRHDRHECCSCMPVCTHVECRPSTSSCSHCR